MPEKQKNSIFREKSIEQVTSPESLNDYIRVTTPPVWLVLAAMLILLAGILIWCVFGTVETHNKEGVAEKIHPIVYVLN